MAVGVAMSCTRADLVRSLWLRDEEALRPALEGALQERLVQARGARLEPRSDARARHLARALQVALSYGVDYNAYRDPIVAAVLRAGYGRPYFEFEDLDAATLRTLIEDRMLVAYSYHPPVYRLVANPLLESLGAFLGLRLPPPVIHEAPLVASLREERVRALRSRMPSVAAGAPVRRGLTPYQFAIRHDLIRSGEGILDQLGLRRLRDCLERVRGHIAAGIPLTMGLVLDYHRILMGDVPKAGEFRVGQVVVANNPYFVTAPPDQVPGLLQAMLERYRRRRPGTLEDLVHDVAWLVNEFLYIHPFDDGNSRTARAAVAHYLGENRSPLGGVPATFDLMFLVGSKGSRTRNDEALAEVVWDMVIHTVNRAELAVRATE